MSSSLPGYLALAALAVLTVGSILRHPSQAWWHGRVAFAGMLGLTVLAAHAPMLNYAAELPNPDEAQLIAGTLTLRQHFAPWLAVDLSTAGPLSILPLLLTPAGYISARWCAAGCASGAVVLCFLALGDSRDHPLARLGTTAVAAFFVFMQDLELFQFSTEHMATVLLGAAAWIWLAASHGGEQSPGARSALVLGCCLGGAVMAKLQSAPCAAWLAGATGILLLLDAGIPWRRRISTISALGAGCLIAPLFFAGLAATQGVLPDMLNSYGLNNVHYVSKFQGEAPGYQPSLVWGLNYLLKPAGGILLASALLTWTFTAAERRVAFVTLGLLVCAVVAVVLPGRGFRHYWFLTLGPLLLAFATVVPPAWRTLWSRWPGARVLPRCVLLAVGAVLLGLPVTHRLPASRDGALLAELAGTASVRLAGEKLRALAQPGDALTIWGWRPELHAYSGLPQGTREAHTEWQIEDIPQRDYYRRRFLADLARNQPRFFADSVGPRDFFYRDAGRAGHETLPALAELIRNRYQFLGETGGVRLYARHER